MSTNRFASKLVLGQYLNLEGSKMFVSTILRNRNSFVPHVKAKSVKSINWKNMRSLGIKYLIFDKDNTLTRPYVREYYSDDIESVILEDCAAEFTLENMAILSNSVGSSDDAPDYTETAQVEETL